MFFEEIRESISEAHQQTWAKLIWHIFKRFDSKQVNLVLTNSQDIPVLKAQFAPLLEPIELGSPRAEELIQSYLEEEKVLQNIGSGRRKISNNF